MTQSRGFSSLRMMLAEFGVAARAVCVPVLRVLALLALFVFSAYGFALLRLR